MTAGPPELTAEDRRIIVATIRDGSLLPCGGHAWSGQHNGTTPIYRLIAIDADGTKRERQLSARKCAVWLQNTATDPTAAWPERTLYSLHDPPCMEHLTYDRTRANQVSVVAETPELRLAGTGVDAEPGSGDGQQESHGEPHDEPHWLPAVIERRESPTRDNEPREAREARTTPKGVGLGRIRLSRQAHDVPWGEARPRRRLSRRDAGVLLAVALVGLLHPTACQAIARSSVTTADRPVPANTETPPPAPTTLTEPVAAPETTTTETSAGPAPMGIPDIPSWAPGRRP